MEFGDKMSEGEVVQILRQFVDKIRKSYTIKDGHQVVKCVQDETIVLRQARDGDRITFQTENEDMIYGISVHPSDIKKDAEGGQWLPDHLKTSVYTIKTNGSDSIVTYYDLQQGNAIQRVVTMEDEHGTEIESRRFTLKDGKWVEYSYLVTRTDQSLSIAHPDAKFVGASMDLDTGDACQIYTQEYVPMKTEATPFHSYNPNVIDFFYLNEVVVHPTDHTAWRKFKETYAKINDKYNVT